MATPNYDINYDDKRFAEVEADKKQALTELNNTYGGMINNSDKYYQAQINASNQWADKQTQLQNEQTEFAIQEIEQQKAQATKDYTKEQSGAYVDWQKQSNQYGANAEQMAAQGLANTGFSESSQVSLFNTYQNRVATARESYNIAVQNFNNAITEARLQNNSILAEIAYEAQQQQLELSLAGFQYKNQLLIEKANKKTELDNTYYARYQDVLDQINTENALAEQVRQYEQNYNLNVKKLNEEIRQFNEEIERLKKKDQQEYALELRQLAQQKALAEKQLAEEQRQFNILHPANSSSGGSGGSGGSIRKSSSSKKSSSSSKKSSSSKGGITKAVQKADTPSSTKSSSSKSSVSVDMNSVIALGYGPISARTLNNLVSSGKVKEYTENGKLKYKKVIPKSGAGRTF